MKLLDTCVILNGPPNSGKDTLADILARDYNFNKHQMKDTLYSETAKHFQVAEDKFIELAKHRKHKEMPLMTLGGRSPREALIYVSEDVIKVAHGKDYFGKRQAMACVQANSKKAVFSDGGFPAEIEPLKDVFNTVYIFRLHREDCTFTSDSRDYLKGFDNTFDINIVEGAPKIAILEILRLLKTGPTRRASTRGGASSLAYG
jgi:hypothetical protein